MATSGNETHGPVATWLDRQFLDHADSIYFPTAVIGTAGFIYGVLARDWRWIVGSSALALLAHGVYRTHNGQQRTEVTR